MKFTDSEEKFMVDIIGDYLDDGCPKRDMMIVRDVTKYITSKYKLIPKRKTKSAKVKLSEGFWIADLDWSGAKKRTVVKINDHDGVLTVNESGSDVFQVLHENSYIVSGFGKIYIEFISKVL